MRGAIQRGLYPRFGKGWARKCLNQQCFDPLELIDRYGADLLRFTLAAMARRVVTSKCHPAGSKAIEILPRKFERLSIFADE